MAYLYGIEGERGKQRKMIKEASKFATRYSQKISATLRQEGIHYLESPHDIHEHFLGLYNKYKVLERGKKPILLKQNQLLDEPQKSSDPAKDTVKNLQVKRFDQTLQASENTCKEVPIQTKQILTAKKTLLAQIDTDKEYAEGSVRTGRYDRKQRSNILIKNAK
ncbi:hypothetical protein H6F61_06480 [Cyanobacteria bacterium FACHB-472]|nr:hypothetical protein [Cyanobacteria bacterium FACHB-472]